jgi:photosystem II stability/assembly factor-like uncharacterized protein
MTRLIGRTAGLVALVSVIALMAPAVVTPAAAVAMNVTGSVQEIRARAVPVPKGFKAQSMNWISSLQGWALGKAPCGQSTCSDVIGTADGGKTWASVGRVKAPIASIGNTSKPGLSEIRFATSKVGWVFGSKLFRTLDGGHTWSPVGIPGQGKQVLALGTSSTIAYAIVSPCAWMTGLCTQKPLSLWMTNTLTTISWTKIAVKLPISVLAGVTVYGKTVYVVDSLNGKPDKFYASTDGLHFSARPDPCIKTVDVQLFQAAPISAKDVALLCDGNPGFSKAEKIVYRSTDTGKTDKYAGTMGPYGIQAQLAASPSGRLAVASWSDGTFIYVNNGGKTSWTMRVAYSDGGAGWNDVQYIANKVAWVVYSPAEFVYGRGKLYVTRDGGKKWYLDTP